MQCRICGNEDNNRIYEAREMMMGLRDTFTYLQCGECKCLQIAEIPDNISKYYSDDYYSFQETGSDGIVKKYLKRLRNKYAMFNRPWVGKFIYQMYPKTTFRSLVHLSMERSMRILDVGCGAGELLQALGQLGFRNLTGIDPFNKKEIIKVGDSTTIYKKSIHDVEGEWDLIMMHHVFEHMPEPMKVLIDVSALLSAAGYCIIRIPVTQSKAWQTYRENWVQLDAPRHFYLHSPKSLQYVVDQTDLKIEKVIYDSIAFQFWGSIQYEHDIPLQHENSYAVNPGKSLFTKDDIRSFAREAEKLNSQQTGDQAIFILRKPR